MLNETEASAQEAVYEPDVQFIERSSITALYRCTLPRSQRQVALKLWANPFIPDSQIQQSFALLGEEISTLKELRDPHILTPLYLRRTLQAFVFVYDYFPYGSLQNLLQHYVLQPLPPRRALSLLQQVGMALHACHLAGVVHGNLTPYNILLRSLLDPAHDEPDNVLLSGFYLPSLQMGRPRTREDDHPLVRFYMAPEHFLGFTSPFTDQYSLGCLAYQLFTGRLPYDGVARVTLRRKHSHDPIPRPTSMNPALPPSLDAPLMRALAKDPARRFPDVAAFLAALDACDLSQAASETNSELDYDIAISSASERASLVVDDQQCLPGPDNDTDVKMSVQDAGDGKLEEGLLSEVAVEDAKDENLDERLMAEVLSETAEPLSDDSQQLAIDPSSELGATQSEEVKSQMAPDIDVMKGVDRKAAEVTRPHKHFFFLSLPFIALFIGLFLLHAASGQKVTITSTEANKD